MRYILKWCSIYRLITESDFSEETTGLEGFGGLRKLEDLRIPFIIPASIYFTSFDRCGPLIKGSRDSATAAKTFTALNFWFVLFQDKMNRKIQHDYMF